MYNIGQTVTLSADSSFLGKPNNPSTITERGTIADIYEDGRYSITWDSGIVNNYSDVDLVLDDLVLSTDGFKWIEQKGQFVYDDATPPTSHDVLAPGIYTPILNQVGNIVGLKLTRRSFSFNYKIYDLDKPFINRVLKTFTNITNNLGILLNGVKGTGKSVTAKMICNQLNIPVILVESKPNNLGPYLNNFKQDVCVLVDEFEKVYDISVNRNNQDSLLTAMDGVHNNEFKKVFILTSNSSRINENLIDRPTRIRYMKEYGNLQLEVITEIVEDLIENKDLLKETIQFISTLNLITVDVIKNVVNEVNIHNESPEEFKDLFNVSYVKPNIIIDVYNLAKDTITKKVIRSSSSSVLRRALIESVDIHSAHSFAEKNVVYVGTDVIDYISQVDEDGFFEIYTYPKSGDDDPVLTGYGKFEVSLSVNEIFKPYVF